METSASFPFYIIGLFLSLSFNAEAKLKVFATKHPNIFPSRSKLPVLTMNV